MLKERVEAALAEISAGNDRGEPITLVAATKTVPAEIINEAISYGITAVAENRVQEFREKDALVSGADKQFIGHLQTNKVKYLVGKVSLIQSVDSFKLASVISETAQKRGVTQDILIEINIGGELSKSGFTPQNAVSSVKEISALPCLAVKGFMAMLPKTDDEKLKEKLCLQMRGLFDDVSKNVLPLKYLSVGMSGDYKTAIRCGSNMIRLGSALFGQRI